MGGVLNTVKDAGGFKGCAGEEELRLQASPGGAGGTAEVLPRGWGGEGVSSPPRGPPPGDTH